MDSFFENAKPVWLKDREKEKHLRVQFKTFFEGKSSKNYVVKVATSGIYHLNVNGEFVCYGPARAGKNHFRVDEIDISNFVKDGQNVVIIEVAGYNITSFYIMQQDSFLQAEIFENGCSIRACNKDFTARVTPYYIQKTEKYSYQRPMLECYRYNLPDTFLFDLEKGTEPITETEEKALICRRAGYPIYEVETAEKIGNGKVLHIEPEKIVRNRSLTYINDYEMTGFKMDELEIIVSELLQKLDSEPGVLKKSNILNNDEYAMYELSHNSSGMLKFSVECDEDTIILITFDEILSETDGKLHPLRYGTNNGIRYELKKGKYDLQFFEVYTMKFIQVSVLKGSCVFSGLSMINYKHPPINKRFNYNNPKLQKIIDAAIETFKQNAVDLYTDCPSRERAGWLCDSFFTSRVGYCLDGNCNIETDFLENFLHEDQFEGLPRGMFHMCYPSDHRNGNFIPNWAMWLVLELEEYIERGGSRELIDRFKIKIIELLEYFEKFENSDGLLENLEKWVFVEWSRANDLVQDVNYPSNMMYYKMLKICDKLYNMPECSKKADRIRNEILKQSYNGKFFVDNAKRVDGKLVLSGETTEVCQYYAFFCGIVDDKSHKWLFDTLVNDFGPDRRSNNKWPDVHFANALPGNYLRLEILMEHKFYDLILENIEGYFYHMAERTGTLWEHADDSNSCNHGFASHVLFWLDKMQ